MKKILSLISIFFCSFTTNAQTCTYQCNASSVNLNNTTLSNQSYNGSCCFNNDGTISNSVNWNNFYSLSFNGNINCQQTINMSGGYKKVFINSNKTVTLNSINFDDSDTLVIGSFVTLEINSITTNNSSMNVIILGNGSSVKINGIVYTQSTTLQTVPTNSTNNINIVSCSNTALSLSPIKSFVYKDKQLQWELNDDFSDYNITLQKQYSGGWDNAQYFNTTFKYEYVSPTGSGFFRLRLRNNITGEAFLSHIVEVKAENKGSKSIIIIDIMGNKITDISSRDPNEIVIEIVDGVPTKKFIHQLTK